MKARAAALILGLSFFVVAVCSAADAFTGTWKLNEAKSKLGPGGGKNTTVIYETTGDNVKVIIDGTDSKGAPTHSEWMGKFDGKAYAVTGNPGEDTRAVRKISDRVLTFTVKKGGKIIETGRIVVSSTGKTRTVTAHSTDAKGNKITSIAVYDKQA